MPSQILSSVENNFTKGLITESTGLNFPENAATDTDNCVYTLVGDVTRREGFDYEENFALSAQTSLNQAISTFKWDNAGGDGTTQLVVAQLGSQLLFYSVNAATTAAPLSTQQLSTFVDISAFAISGNTAFNITECEYTQGNGYLFVFNKFCNPFYCTYTAGSVTAQSISVKTRDLSGVFESIDYSTRSSTLTQEHNYNLFNQGWSSSQLWTATSTTTNLFGVAPGTIVAFDIGTSALPISPGDVINCSVTGYPVPGTPIMSFTVSTYSGNIVRGPVVAENVYSVPFLWSNWVLNPISLGNLSTWKSATNNYPSNADVWWRYKNASGVFSPSTTYQNVSLALGPAPKGHFILEAFNQQKTGVSGVTGISSVVTTNRPSTGAWFAGRVWYAGVNASQPAQGDAIYYSWTENIYFSQTVVDPTQFGLCYQTNDPTSQDLFDLLPTDGGVITIQGCGAVYKLFPIQNGMLVFAANGVWFITGSQGIGFAANDYTITKISNVQSISSTSFVNVLGLPYFWNHDGIYTVQPSQQGSLTVEPLTVSTILTFFNSIPKSSIGYVRGAYDPIDYVITWLFRSTDESGISNRYDYDRMLSYNTYNKAFYPYTVSAGANINSILYVTSPGSITSSPPILKYLTSNTAGRTTFSEERDSVFVDWKSLDSVGVDYTSYFITGYKLRGMGMNKFQPTYIRVYSKTNEVATSYKIQGIWDYASDRSSGKWSNEQLVTNAVTRFAVVSRRHRIRGQGYTLQFKVTSQDGMPFDIIGWAIIDTVNTGA